MLYPFRVYLSLTLSISIINDKVHAVKYYYPVKKYNIYIYFIEYCIHL